MAGDWMKIELELPDKPEVHAIASMLNIEPDAVVGKLIRVWQWFDKHTTDGNAHGVTYLLPDRISGVTGFGEAMSFVGWLEQKDKTLSMPKFDRHTSASAKARALTAKRVNKNRSKSNAKSNADSVTDSVTSPLPREEKRRIDISTTDVVDKATAKKPPRFDAHGHLMSVGIDKQLADDWLAVRKAKKAAPTKTAIDGIASEANKAGISLAEALSICCQRGWASFKNSWDWNPQGVGQPARPVNGRQAAISNYAAQAAAARGSYEPSSNVRDITGEACRVA